MVSKGGHLSVMQQTLAIGDYTTFGLIPDVLTIISQTKCLWKGAGNLCLSSIQENSFCFKMIEEVQTPVSEYSLRQHIGSTYFINPNRSLLNLWVITRTKTHTVHAHAHRQTCSHTTQKQTEHKGWPCITETR